MADKTSQMAMWAYDLDTGDLLGIVSYVDVLRAVQETLETT